MTEETMIPPASDDHHHDSLPRLARSTSPADTLHKDTPHVDDEEEGGGKTTTASPKELEAGVVSSSKEKSTTTKAEDPDLVDWEGPDDPANPKNWSFRRKWITITMVSLFTLQSPIASSTIAPALPEVSRDLGIPQGSVLQSMSLSIFVLAYAIGPLFLGPLSEMYGRQIVIQLTNLFFLVFNIACSQAKTPAQLIVFRFFAGLGGSAPQAIGGGTIADLFDPKDRGKATALYTLMPLMGPALGPIAGGFIAENTTWRWIFYATSILDGLVQFVGFFVLRETYTPRLLQLKARRLRKETGNLNLKTKFEREEKRTPLQRILHGITRPIRFLMTEPILWVMASYMAVLYGINYLVLSSFASVWTGVYHESTGISGLHYAALGIGLFLGVQIGSRVMDRVYKIQTARNDGKGTPEMRLPSMMFMVWLIPVGLILFGWTADKRVFWLVPDIGIAILAFGLVGAFFCIQIYVIDTYNLHAASGVAALACFRSLAGFGFPLFADAMFKKLGTGWGNSVLALVALIFCPAPFLFYKFGPYLRSKSPYTARMAAHS